MNQYAYASPVVFHSGDDINKEFSTQINSDSEKDVDKKWNF